MQNQLPLKLLVVFHCNLLHIRWLLRLIYTKYRAKLTTVNAFCWFSLQCAPLAGARAQRRWSPTPRRARPTSRARANQFTWWGHVITSHGDPATSSSCLKTHFFSLSSRSLSRFRTLVHLSWSLVMHLTPFHQYLWWSLILCLGNERTKIDWFQKTLIIDMQMLCV